MTLDILICSLNKGIVRIDDLLRPEQEGVRYVVSYQYTDERYLELVPEILKQRRDVVLSVYKGQGLSNNRNHALELSRADLVIFADDDSRLSEDAPKTIEKIFSEDAELDVAFFRASTYTGKLLTRKRRANLRKCPRTTTFRQSKWFFVGRRCRIDCFLMRDLGLALNFLPAVKRKFGSLTHSERG